MNRESTLLFQGSLIASNNASTNAGGGIYAFFSDAWFNKTTIENNTATQAGGIYFSNDKTLTILYSNISMNVAGKHGGVLLNNSTKTCIVSDTIFISNRATTGDGGAFSIQQSIVQFSNVQYSLNTAYGKGGGIYAAGSQYTASSVHISNSRAAAGGGT